MHDIIMVQVSIFSVFPTYITWVSFKIAATQRLSGPQRIIMCSWQHACMHYVRKLNPTFVRLLWDRIRSHDQIRRHPDHNDRSPQQLNIAIIRHLDRCGERCHVHGSVYARTGTGTRKHGAIDCCLRAQRRAAAEMALRVVRTPLCQACPYTGCFHSASAVMLACWCGEGYSSLKMDSKDS
jgi:hypothetical protein